MEQKDQSGQRKPRRKSSSVKDFEYDVSDFQCECIQLHDVEKSSGATVKTKSSSDGRKYFLISGSRSQIREALRIITIISGRQKEILKNAETFWLWWIEETCPDFDNQAYFFPPIYIKRLPITERKVAGHHVLMLKDKKQAETTFSEPAPVSGLPFAQDSDLIFDEAVERVLCSLQKMSETQKEVFVCLSKFSFGSYLNETHFAPAAAHLPLPTNLPRTFPWNWQQGDFDVLIIHRTYGFVICEIKAVGYNNETPQEEQDKHVTKKMAEAMKQLNKAETMLSHLVSDIAPGMRITKTIACPNLTNLQIKKILNENEQLKKDLCQCFKIEDSHDISCRLLCSDNLSAVGSSPDEGDDKMAALRQWWKKCVAGSGPDAYLSISPPLYKILIARFCGPASTVTVPSVTEPRVSLKTWSQAIAHVGDCYTSLITLFPEQTELLSRAPRRAFLCGPPGTGKTVVLLLMAKQWLLHNKHVCVLSIWNGSLSASSMLHHLLWTIVKTQLKDVAVLHRIQMIKLNLNDKNDIDKCIDDLTLAAKGGPMYVIADEVGPDLLFQKNVFPVFCTRLLNHFQDRPDDLYFWAASCRHNHAPEKSYLWDGTEEEGWELQRFTRPLRSPPSVIREINKAVEIKNKTAFDYDKREVPDHTDGPAVHWVNHQHKKLPSVKTHDCHVCGNYVATFLCEKLRLADDSKDDSTASKAEGSFTGSRPPSILQYKDVIILSMSEIDEDAAILKEVKDKKIPVHVMRYEDIEDVATSRSNVVWVATYQQVRGLERKVVVCLDNDDDSKGVHPFIRLHAMSRCSSQLVVVSPLNRLQLETDLHCHDVFDCKVAT